MIQDFAIEQDNFGLFDLAIDVDNKDFKTVEGFESAIYFQIFCERRTTKEDVANPLNRRGWICDLLTRNEGYEIGSLIWLKNQTRNTQTDKEEIAAFVITAFEHLKAIRAIKDISIEFINDNFEITIKANNGETTRYSKLWRLTNADTN